MNVQKSKRKRFKITLYRLHICLCMSTSHQFYFAVILLLYVCKCFSLGINIITFPKIIDSVRCNTSFTISPENIGPFLLLFSCNVIIRYNTSQQNNYFLFATTLSLINAIFIYLMHKPNLHLHVQDDEIIHYFTYNENASIK